MSDKKKKGGCLKIGFIAFSLFMALGMLLSFFDDLEWKKERVSIIEQITQATAAGDYSKAYKLTEPHLQRIDTDEEFATLTQEILEWHEQHILDQLLAEIQTAHEEKDYTQVLTLSEKHQSQLSEIPESASVIKQAHEWKKAREAENIAAEKKAQAQALAAIPPHQRIKDQLHLTLGSKVSLLGKERKWSALRNVDAAKGTGHASISFNSESAELLIYNKISKVIEVTLSVEEIETLNIQAYTQYLDTNGNEISLPFISVYITREAAKQANWKNLRSYGQVEQFLKKKGEVGMREDR